MNKSCIFQFTKLYTIQVQQGWTSSGNLGDGRSPLQKLDEILEDPMTTQDGIMREIDGRCNRDGDYDLEANNIKRRDW
ncbi:hypothetical protein YC2023_080756 [Brassica napus]